MVGGVTGTTPCPRLKTCPCLCRPLGRILPISRAIVSGSAQKDDRIQIALQRYAVAYRAPRGRDVDGPVYSDAVGTDVGDFSSHTPRPS